MTAVAEFHWRRYSSRGNGIPLFQRDLRKGNDYPSWRMFFFSFWKGSTLNTPQERKRNNLHLQTSKGFSRIFFKSCLPQEVTLLQCLFVLRRYQRLCSIRIQYKATQEFTEVSCQDQGGTLVAPQADNKPSSARGRLTRCDSRGKNKIKK